MTDREKGIAVAAVLARIAEVRSEVQALGQDVAKIGQRLTEMLSSLESMTAASNE